MSKQTEDRLAEIYKWYAFHKGTIPPQDVMKKTLFLQKAIDCMFELIVRQQEEIQSMEHKNGTRSVRLWMPSGVEIHGDLTKLG